MAAVAVRRESLRGYIQGRRDQIRKTWERHETIPRLLLQYFPEIWNRVRACRYDYQAYNRVDDAALWTARPKACHKIPWCIPCTYADNVQRALEAVDDLWHVTPPGQPIAVHHVVITAPYTEQGLGWGSQARQDLPKFFATISGSLREIFGQGAGGIMSYQDFGERPFTKPHPHMDSVINGYSLLGNEVTKLGRLNLEFGGADRVKAVLQKYAMAFRLDARPGNYHVRHTTGAAEVFQTVRYSLRHMVDFRNFSYDGDKRVVWYQPYKDSLPEKLPVNAFVAWLDEYRTRLGQYDPPNGLLLRIHRRFGHLGKGMFKLAKKIIGGSPPDHKIDCQCLGCQDWRKVYDGDFGQLGVREAALRPVWGLREPLENVVGAQ